MPGNGGAESVLQSRSERRIALTVVVADRYRRVAVSAGWPLAWPPGGYCRQAELLPADAGYRAAPAINAATI